MSIVSFLFFFSDFFPISLCCYLLPLQTTLLLDLIFHKHNHSIDSELRKLGLCIFTRKSNPTFSASWRLSLESFLYSQLSLQRVEVLVLVREKKWQRRNPFRKGKHGELKLLIFILLGLSSTCLIIFLCVLFQVLHYRFTQ